MHTAFNILKAVLGKEILGLAVAVVGITIFVAILIARLIIPIAIAIMAVCGARFVFQAVF